LGNAPRLTSNVTNSFDALNGTLLQGQTLSLDFTFSSDEFVRLFTVTSSSFVALLKLQTTGLGPNDFLTGTGFLVDHNGNPVEPPETLGAASGSSILAAGLFPLLSGDLQRPTDFFGIHMDLTLPLNTSVSITGEELLLMSEHNGPFGVGPGLPPDVVPEQGGTLLFQSLGFLALILARFRLIQFS
jgi:hypothetical protein